MRIAGILAASTLCFGTHLAAQEAGTAENFPSKPVHIIVPFPPGGGVDTIIRAVAAGLDTKWGQRVVVENKLGAASVIGAQAVAGAPADGYTLLATINQTVTSNRFLFKNLPYDPDKDFAPVSLMTSSDQMLLVNAKVPVNSLRDLVEQAPAKNPPFAFGSFGNGSQPHLLYETLKHNKGIDLIHVPYKGVAPMLTGLAGGEIQFGVGSANVAGPLIEAGRIRPIAIAGEHRSPVFPDVPTTTEAGYPDLQAQVWYALFAPGGTPRPIVGKISEDVADILKNPEFIAQYLAPRGLNLVAGGPDALAEAIQKDVRLTQAMVQAAGVKPE